MLLAFSSVMVLDEVVGSRPRRQMLDYHYARLVALMAEVAAHTSRMLLQDLEAAAVVDERQRVVHGAVEVDQNRQVLC